MPPSQLKRLKASLREQGITGQQSSKKQKKNSHGASVDQRLQRQAALQKIRDSFNPFEVKAPARNPKFASMSDRKEKVAVARPGVTRGMGEQVRRQNLLPELQNRSKTGGIMDRRIGEDDSTMTPEEKALQRFIREKQRKKGGATFDLEADDEEGQTGLTHLGRALNFGEGADAADDFDGADLSGSESGSDGEGRLLKRRRASEGEGPEGEAAEEIDGELPARKKSKQEVMKEVMAKSKLHKYERQKAKEDDDDLRAQLDADLGDLLPFLRGHKPEPPKKEPPPVATMNADRLAMMEGKSRQAADKEYDARLRQMAMDQRAAPTERTKTEEERAEVEAQRLRDLETARQRRMRGEESEESGNEKEKASKGAEPSADAEDDAEDEERNDAAEFGFNVPSHKSKTLVLEDEDEFDLDEDLLASGSESGSMSESDDEGSGSDDDVPDGHDYDDEEEGFVKGILDPSQASKTSETKSGAGIAYTYPCPRSHEELLAITAKLPDSDLPTVIQRIRALYHPSLTADNQEKLAQFAVSLVDHLAYEGPRKSSLPVAEQVMRHLHSLSRSYPERIAGAFRDHLSALAEKVEPDAGDLMILTAIGSIYPTSDHFHQVVTPAMTLMARWLGMTTPTTDVQLRRGACVVSLALHYQRISKRYIPEALRFTLAALQRKPRPAQDILDLHLPNIITMAEQYRHLPAFIEIFTPSTLSVLKSLPASKTLQHLQILLSQSRLSRRPLALHHHRPQAIRTSIPKFEENFAPGRHYDFDKERSEAAKLKKEYKREKKGAVRELRKDANFIAREQLRQKKEADVAYETKFRKLVAQINSEEGREGNEYERVRERRKRGR